MEEIEDLTAEYESAFEDVSAKGDIAGDLLPIDAPELSTQVDNSETTEVDRIAALIDERVNARLQQIEADNEKRHQQVNGKFGELNRKILEARSAGTTLSPSSFKHVAEVYGEEYAEALAKDLGGVTGGESSSASIERQNDLIISIKHRGWQEDVRSPEFEQWQEALSPEFREKVRTATDPHEFSDLLDSYKELKQAEKDSRFVAWREKSQLPADQLVSTYKSWVRLAEVPGFSDWAESLVDDVTRNRIGNDSDAEFIAQAEQAFLEFKKQPPVVVKKKDTRVEMSVLPTSTQSADVGGDSLEDHFLAAFKE